MESMRKQHLMPLPQPRRWRAGGSGRLVVQQATAWITRDGDPDDHVLQPGQALRVQEGDWLTAESWHRDAPARLLFEPLRQPHWSAPLQRWFWTRTARSAATLARRLDAVAQSWT